MSIILKGFGGPLLITKGYGVATAKSVFGTLSGAIINRFNRSPIAALVPGGLSFGSASKANTGIYPYGVIQFISEPLEDSTRGPQQYNAYWQASFFAPEGYASELNAIRDAWRDTFDPIALKQSPLYWTRANLIRFANLDSRFTDDEVDAPGAGGSYPLPLDQLIIEFLVVYSPKAN